MNKLLLPLTISLAVGSLAACDTDNEEVAEYKAPGVQTDTVHVVFSDLDTNRDMRISRMEAERMPELVAVFDDIDSDNDNRLATEELVVITDWDDDLDQDQFALLTAVESHTHIVDDSATAMNRPTADQGYDSSWPSEDEQDLSASAELDANRLDSDLDTQPTAEFDTLDPTGEDAVAASEYPPQPADEFSTLDPAEDVEMEDDAMAATETEAENDSEPAAESDEPDAGVSLAEVRLNENRDLEVADGDSYIAAEPQQVQVIFDSADVDGDDRLSEDEAGEIDGLAAAFAELDADGDGLLVYTEFDQRDSTA